MTTAEERAETKAFAEQLTYSSGDEQILADDMLALLAEVEALEPQIAALKKRAKAAEEMVREVRNLLKDSIDSEIYFEEIEQIVGRIR
jgi:hypothetical protein